MDLDPAVFGENVTVDAFSATGDQLGFATFQGRHLDVTVSSPLAGFGRLPGLPILAVTATVSSGAAAGAVASVSFQNAVGRDLNNVDYSIAPLPGSLTVGGTLSVSRVTMPFGGMLPEGTEVRIEGTGFSVSTTVRIDGVSLASTQLVSAKELSVTLGAPTDLTGKRMLLSDEQGGQTEYYPAFHVPNELQGLILSQQTYAAVATDTFSATIALENQTPQPVDVLFRELGSGHTQGGSCSITVPPLSALYPSLYRLCPFSSFEALVVPAVPLRMAYMFRSSGSWIVSAPDAGGPPTSQLTLLVDNASVSAASWDWQIGTSPPPPKTVSVQIRDLNASFTVTASTDSGGDWLQLSATRGNTCTSVSCPASSRFTISANVSQLALGSYHGTISVLPNTPYAEPTLLPINLNVSASPTIYVSTDTAFLYGAESRTIAVTSNGNPAPISASVATTSGRTWLGATLNQSTTPATLTLTSDAALLPAGGDTATVSVNGPANSRTISVSADLPPTVITPYPASLDFTVLVGQAAPPSRNINVPSNFAPVTASIQTEDDGSWLHAARGSVDSLVTVSVDPARLSAGTYRGSVTISSAMASSPATVPVTLRVLDTPPPVTASPTSLTITCDTSPSGCLTPRLYAATGDLSIPVAISSDDGGGGWLIAAGGSVTPVGVNIVISGAKAVGSYQGSITITAPPGSTNKVTVPVTLLVVPAPPPLPQPGPPLVTAVLNTASMAGGAMAPGEMVTLLGQNLGSDVPDLAGTRVLFDGVPASLLYAFSTQVNAIVPDEVAGKAVTSIRLEAKGATVSAGGVPVAASAPGIFTLTGSGAGPAAILNQDGSVNTPAQPALPGSMVQIFATGGGAASTDRNTVLPVGVTIGDLDATVTFAGSASGGTAGLFQVNAVIPAGTAPGPAIPIVLTVGSARSQDSVTISVK